MTGRFRIDVETDPAATVIDQAAEAVSLLLALDRANVLDAGQHEMCESAVSQLAQVAAELRTDSIAHHLGGGVAWGDGDEG